MKLSLGRVKLKNGGELVSILLPMQIVKELGWSPGDIIDVDLPVTGGGLTIHKVEQRTGDETI